MGDLADAIAKRERLYRDGIDRLRELAPAAAENEVHEITSLLREAIELAGCCRRLTHGRTAREIHDAFGAPGDFGYENEIGAALARIYRGDPEPSEGNET